MSPARHEGNRRIPIESWGNEVDRQIREAQERGEFDNLPGAGKPLDLEDNPHAGEWQSAFRVARNAGAAPLWVELDKEIRAELEALRAMAERTARHLQEAAPRLRAEAPSDGEGTGPPPPGTSAPLRRSRWRRWLFGPAPRGAGEASPGGPQTLGDLEAERRRARTLYLSRAAEVDEKIKDFNSHRPRNLTWLEKPRLPPEGAARQFDELCPPISR